MKLTTEERLKAHETQIVSNSVRLQSLINILLDNGIINEEDFIQNNRSQLEEMEKQLQHDANKETEIQEDDDTEFPFYGEMGEA